VKKYNLIYADPPWAYQDKRNTPTKNNPTGAGGACKHYKTLSLEQLKSIDVPSLCAENCMLLLWCTLPKLDWGIELLKYWGFCYCTVPFVWVKMRNDGAGVRMDGIGHYTPNNCEIVLLGRKGRYWRSSTKVKQIVFAPKGGHSAKPAEVRERIELLYGDVPRIELFARVQTPGWDVWGNEVEGDVEL